MRLVGGRPGKTRGHHAPLQATRGGARQRVAKARRLLRGTRAPTHASKPLMLRPQKNTKSSTMPGCARAQKKTGGGGVMANDSPR